MSTTRLPLDAIRLDGGTQARASINHAAVDEYAEALSAGATFPAVTVFFDGADHWLADGFHRVMAHQRIGAVEIDVEVRTGHVVDAQIYASGANQAHGLRRTNEDKRNAVVRMLTLAPSWSDRAVARHVGVSDKTVAAHRQAICGNSADATVVRTVERNGKTYEQDTAGQRKAAAAKKQVTHTTPSRSPTRVDTLATDPPTAGVPVDPRTDDTAEADAGCAVDLDGQADVAATTITLHLQLQNALARVAELEATMAANVNTPPQVDLARRLDHAIRRQHDLMAAAAEIKRSADFYENQLTRCGRAIGQHDLGRVAAAVEALARQAGGTDRQAAAEHIAPAPAAPAVPDREYI